MHEPIVVFITTESTEQANEVARALLEPRLAACVNCVPGVVSHYWWQGKLEQSSEVLLVVKTRRDLLDPVVAAVKAAHSYGVPEVVALPIVGGNPDYMAWLEQETTPTRP